MNIIKIQNNNPIDYTKQIKNGLNIREFSPEEKRKYKNLMDFAKGTAKAENTSNIDTYC